MDFHRFNPAPWPILRPGSPFPSTGWSMGRCCGSALALGSVLFLHGAEGKPVQINLISSMEVRERNVTLGDISVITASDEVLRAKLASLPLGRSPRPGECVRIDRGRLQRWVRNRLGRSSESFRWCGSDEICIQSAGQVVLGERIAQAAVEAAGAAYAKSSFRADVQAAEEIRPMTVPVGNLELKVKDKGRTSVSGIHSQPSTRQIVSVEIWVDKQFIRTVPVAVAFHLRGPGWVATRDLSVGEIPGAGELELHEIEWSGRVSSPVLPSSGAAPRNLRMKRSLAAGEVVSEDQVETLPLVLRGQFANARTIQGAIMVECRAEVLEDGALGRIVRIKVPQAASSVPARVLAEGLVEVMP